MGQIWSDFTFRLLIACGSKLCYIQCMEINTVQLYAQRSATIFHDDNFGRWDIEDDDDLEMYYRTQDTNVEKICVGCNRTVHIQPHYDVCDSCATKREQGWDI